MKNKQTNKGFFVCLLIALFFLSNCRKDFHNPKPDRLQAFSSKQEVKKYLNQKLNEYGEVLAKLAQNPKVRKLINQKVAQKFDGDYNVLLKDLLSEKLIKTTSTRKTTNEELVDPGEPSETVEPADMEALTDLLTEPPLVVGTDTLYPQIYIPFYEEHMGLEEPEDPCPSSEGSPTIDYPYPVIVTYDGEEIPGQDTFTGYSYDTSGSIIDGIVVDECFAQKHLVWAVTINERVNGSGTPPAASGSSSPQSSSATFPDLYISTLVFKADKESWIKGANEVFMQYGYSWENGINPSTGNIDFTGYQFYSSNPLSAYSASGSLNLMLTKEIFLADVTNKNVRKKSLFNLNKTISNSITSYYPSRGTHLYIVIYEQDGLGSLIFGGRQSQVINGFNTGMTFISNDPPYMSTALKIVPKSSSEPQPNTDYAYIINGEIEYKSLYR